MEILAALAAIGALIGAILSLVAQLFRTRLLRVKTRHFEIVISGDDDRKIEISGNISDPKDVADLLSALSTSTETKKDNAVIDEPPTTERGNAQ